MNTGKKLNCLRVDDTGCLQVSWEWNKTEVHFVVIVIEMCDN